MRNEGLGGAGRAVGRDVPGWTERPPPPATTMTGRVVRLEPLDPARHGPDLFAAQQAEPDDAAWAYLGTDRAPDRAAHAAWLDGLAQSADPQVHAVVERARDRAVGIAAFLRIDAGNGVIEIGHLHFAPALRGGTGGAEAVFLMMRRVFDELGYRRLEWKCDALNAASLRAALRYGFTAEGVFRQALVVKGRNRDTAWHSVLDREWPAIKRAFETWLDVSNFDAQEQQRVRLDGLIAASRSGG